MGRLRPPLPTEHGAIVMTTAALITPLVALVPGGLPASDTLLAYAGFVGLVAIALLIRESLKQRSLSSDRERLRQLNVVASLEAATLVALAGALAAAYDPRWLLAVALIPLAGLNLYLGSRNWPVPVGNELAGVFGLSLIVPVGVVVLGATELWLVGGLWLLFATFHVGSVLRVGTQMIGSGPTTRRLVTLMRVYHVGLVGVAALAWITGWVSLLAPLVFVAAVWRAEQLVTAEPGSVSLKALGQSEAALSTLFVLALPWVLV